MPQQPTPVQRLRNAFDAFLKEAHNILAEIEATEALAPTIDPKVNEIKKAVAAYYHVPITILDARIRRTEAVWPRHVAMYLSVESTRLTWQQVAHAFRRDQHSTVIHAYRAVKNAIDTSPRYKRQIEDLQRQFPSIH
jgi:chromosomal replication initiation ATPase DnaA